MKLKLISILIERDVIQLLVKLKTLCQSLLAWLLVVEAYRPVS